MLKTEGNGFTIEPSDELCKHSRYHHYLGQFMGQMPVYTHQGCVANEWTSLVKRHLVNPPKMSHEFILWGMTYIALLTRWLPEVESWSPTKVINSRPARMKKRYEAAFKTHLEDKHANVSMFIKFEKMHDPTKPPRAIQFRHTVFTANYAKYILPIEKSLYGMTLDNHGFCGFAKGKNGYQRASDLRSMFEYYPEPRIILADHSKFDSCVNSFHLYLTHTVYKAMIKNEKFDHLMRAQYYNKGYTRFGIKYTCQARRMSGDADTALGNSLVNYVVLRFMYGDQAIIYCDGDDSVVFLPTGSHTVRGGTGFNTVTQIVEEFHEIEFCQCLPVLTSGGWFMAREPIRAASRMMVRCGGIVNNSFSYTMGLGEALASPEIPLIATACAVLMEPGGKFNANLLEYRHKIAKASNKIHLPTTDSIMSSCLAWDMPSEVLDEWIGRLTGIVLNPKICVMQRSIPTEFRSMLITWLRALNSRIRRVVPAISRPSLFQGLGQKTTECQE